MTGLPAVRFRWALPQGSAELLAFAPMDGTEDQPLHVASQQPVHLRYLNVSADGRLLHSQYVDTYETYPNYCPRAPKEGFPTQLECEGEGAEGFYAALLLLAQAWNRTFAAEGAMEVDLPVHGIDIGAFGKHSVARMMITRRDLYFPSYGAAPMYYGVCCDGFQDVLVADLATYLEWGLFDTAKGGAALGFGLTQNSLSPRAQAVADSSSGPPHRSSRQLFQLLCSARCSHQLPWARVRRCSFSPGRPPQRRASLTHASVCVC